MSRPLKQSELFKMGIILVLILAAGFVLSGMVLRAEGSIVQVRVSQLAYAPPTQPLTSGAVPTTGTLVPTTVKKWHPLELEFNGPTHNEMDNSPNPFLDYTLNVTLTSPTQKSYVVPGFFDGDGKGNGFGNKWKMRFSPPETGGWEYALSFTLNGSPHASLDGKTGTFHVTPNEDRDPNFLKWGWLEYVEGSHYPKFRDGSYFLKGAADSPETFLAYRGFDNTTYSKTLIHAYAPHAVDWKDGDPYFVGDGGYDSKNIIGALNYLNQQKVNFIYFLPMNIGGDGRDTWPYAGTINPAGSGSNDNLHFDISKLHQWNTVFAHAQRKEIGLHFVLCENENENKLELDNATLGIERKLFYREMIARYGYLNVIEWNVCEEYDGVGASLDLGTNVINFADYIQQVDWVNRMVAVHNYDDPVSLWSQDGLFTNPALNTTSIQWAADYGTKVEQFYNATLTHGRTVIIGFDEPSSSISLSAVEDDSHRRREDVVWPTLLSGGFGFEIYINTQDQTLENFKTFESMWKYSRLAREFLQSNFNYWQMQPRDDLASGMSNAQVLANVGNAYAVYLPANGTISLNMPAGNYRIRWYNPRTGEYSPMQTLLSTGGATPIGNPPPSFVGATPLTNDVAAVIQRV